VGLITLPYVGEGKGTWKYSHCMYLDVNWRSAQKVIPMERKVPYKIWWDDMSDEMEGMGWDVHKSGFEILSYLLSIFLKGLRRTKCVRSLA
jgi:hypothetical protein